MCLYKKKKIHSWISRGNLIPIVQKAYIIQRCWHILNIYIEEERNIEKYPFKNPITKLISLEPLSMLSLT